MKRKGNAACCQHMLLSALRKLLKFVTVATLPLVQPCMQNQHCHCKLYQMLDSVASTRDDGDPIPPRKPRKLDHP